MSHTHSPGPWKVEGQTITGPQYAIIADIPFPGMEPAGNARLIAAAPDLLEALVLLVDAVKQDVALFPGQPHKESRLGIAVAAIEKATGKPIPVPTETADGPFDATFDAIYD